jgi:hypothetical protein
MWRHPKYYKELRKRNKAAQVNAHSVSISDQAISERVTETSNSKRSPGPGLKQQGSGSSNKQQADKAQATETQASSSKR